MLPLRLPINHLAAFLLLICQLHSSGVLALRTGAPSVACLTLRPLHGLHRSKPASASQFYVTQSSLSYEPNQTISVDVSTQSNERFFRGFIVQAYDPISGNQVGTFEETEESRPISCSASTHRNNAKKQRVTLIWTPPPAAAPSATGETEARSSQEPPVSSSSGSGSSSSSGSSAGGVASGISQWLGFHSPANFNVSMSKRQLVMGPLPALMQPPLMGPPPVGMGPGIPMGPPMGPPMVLVPGGFQPGAVGGIAPATGGIIVPRNAPSPLAKQVRFRATVVVSYEEFYVGYESSDRIFDKFDYAKKST